MANYFKVQGPIAAFTASKMKQLGFKNIRLVDTTGDECFILMKDGSQYELKLRKIE